MEFYSNKKNNNKKSKYIFTKTYSNYYSICLNTRDESSVFQVIYGW